MAKTNVTKKFIDNGFGGMDLYSWDETCDKCGCVISGKETSSSKEPDITEADFCFNCIRYFTHNNISYPEAKMTYKINVKELKDKYLKEMDALHTIDDPEQAHGTADNLLCALLSELGYDDIVESFSKIEKWYS